MKWDYYTYQRQPLGFLVDVWSHMQAEERINKERSDEMGRKSIKVKK